jgi:hypothetical protein
MCTIILLNKISEEFPLIVAANRDENLDRASSPVQVLLKEPIIIGGKDDVKGGTWLGVNQESLFATITNQNTTDNTKKLSRGKIVIDALKCRSLKELLSFVEELNPFEYNDFNLVFGNQDAVYVAHSYLLHSMVIREIPKGINIISNNVKFTGTDDKTRLIHDLLAPINNTYNWLTIYKDLKSLLSTTDYGIRCKPRKNREGKITGKTTISSTILAFDPKGLVRYKFYDRSQKIKAGVKSHRYIDYIDLWRNPEMDISKLISFKNEESRAVKPKKEKDNWGDLREMTGAAWDRETFAKALIQKLKNKKDKF